MVETRGVSGYCCFYVCLTVTRSSYSVRIETYGGARGCIDSQYHVFGLGRARQDGLLTCPRPTSLEERWILMHDSCYICTRFNSVFLECYHIGGRL